MPRLYGAKIRATNLGSANEAVITFAVIDQPGGLPNADLDKFWAERINAVHASFAQNNIVANSSMVEVNVRDSAPGSVVSVVPVTRAGVISQITSINADQELLDTPFFATTPIIPSVGAPLGQGVYTPIGCSMMMSEGTTGGKGRVFIPFPSFFMLDAGTGKINPNSLPVLRNLWRWFHQLTPQSLEGATNNPDRGLTAVYSRRANVARSITSVSTKGEFSNLASRRR